jgi:N-acetylglucosaminyl-diphospho-decaprenol L-rhamnosyltransferase
MVTRMGQCAKFASDVENAELTVIIISYNTAQLTLKAIETLFANTIETKFNCVVFDNASKDNSVAIIRAAYPRVHVIASKENIGFARANNLVARECKTPYLLLLNPDTETQSGAIDALMAFAKFNPHAGIWGGRTTFADGTLNIASCWAVPTVRSLLFRASGLTALLPRSQFISPETYGGWQRDSIRDVDIVVGCFLLVGRPLWQQLGGFRAKYYMYGEDADLCLRARKLGFQPAITPKATIIHHVGASTSRGEEKAILVMKSRASLIRDHWPQWKIGTGIFLMWVWAALRFLVTRPLGLSRHTRLRNSAKRWHAIWTRRAEWLPGYA